MEFDRNPTLDALCARKSVRVFTEEPVPQAVKNALFQAAMQAPTAGNQMLYTILDITDAALKARLADLCDHQPFIADAPVVLVFVADCQRWYDGFAAAGCAPRPPREGDLLLAARTRHRRTKHGGGRQKASALAAATSGIFWKTARMCAAHWLCRPTPCPLPCWCWAGPRSSSGSDASPPASTRGISYGKTVTAA
ncbi:MAG: nitroreductase family protein [Ruthenibacterium lactatiformans]